MKKGFAAALARCEHTRKESMRQAHYPAAFVFALTMMPIAANAQLIGSSVTGTLTSPPSGSPNYFAPANGYVPSGYPNSSGTTVTITGGVEFAFLQGGGTVAAPGTDSITAAFTGSTLTLAQNINASWVSGVDAWTTVFTDPAFLGLSISKTSDTFAQGGANATLIGDTLTITVGPNCGNGVCTWRMAQTAQFSLIPSPSTDGPIPLWALGALGAGLLGIASRRLKEPHRLRF